VEIETEKSEAFSSEISQFIQNVRKNLGHTQKEFARLLDVPLGLLRSWEKGQSSPSPEYIQKIRDIQSSMQNREEENPGYKVPAIDFTGNAERVRLIVEGSRLSYGYLFNPTFATEISRIDPLPHQRLAVYEHMLPQTRLRFLLADDAGAGKTIMTGLYIREMLSRRLITRVLIVPPAGLVGNWEQELRRLFDLQFTIISGSEARHTNPFTEPSNDLMIVSVSTLCGDRLFAHLQNEEVKPYDLVVFDEAHKLAAYRDQDLRIHKTARFRLAEALAGVFIDDDRWRLNWSCQHLLLLSATPHMGKDMPYYFLWSLLEPNIFTSYEAFKNYTPEAKRAYFIRRTKEEMIDFAGQPIYPRREATTLGYDLTQGLVSEQTLYEETTSYIHDYYNSAVQLNRSAVCLAMSVFQRRLASSTWALLRSLQRRRVNLQTFVEELEGGNLPLQYFRETQHNLDTIKDTFESKTADEEESPKDGKEENEGNEQDILRSTLANTLEELRRELSRVSELCQLAQQVFETVEDTKFEKVRELLRDERYSDQKILIFTEHRDTLDFLVTRLEGLGYADLIASIHGGMDYQRREEEVVFFRRPIEQGGARFMVATDAAGEGINLQVCWIMLNYDLPWNPARLEQRMGRIHRYGQKHDPVYIFNLVACNTREGRVMRTLLEKLERIKVELGSDKVYDVLGQLMEGISLQEYMRQLQEEDVEQVFPDDLNKERVLELQQKDQLVQGGRDTIRGQLARLQQEMAQEKMQWLLPGYMRQFIEHAAALFQLDIEGSLEQTFRFHSTRAGGLQWLYRAIEHYPAERQQALTLYPYIERDESIFLHPGEPVFERIRDRINLVCAQEARRGAAFEDASTQHPYLYHLLEATIIRREDPAFPQLQQREILRKHLIAFKQYETQEIELCAVEELLRLRPLAQVPEMYLYFALHGEASRSQVLTFAQHALSAEIGENYEHDFANKRAEAIELGFEYLEIDLLNRRARLQGKQSGANAALIRSELTKIEQHYASLTQRKVQTLAALRRESELIEVGEIIPLAHALVVPIVTTEPHTDLDVEQRAMQVAMTFERGQGAEVFDVSNPANATRMGLSSWPGFDVLAKYATGEQRAIEIKGRVGMGTIEMSENEYGKACTLRERYWLYVVFDCEKQYPRLIRVQDPFGKLVVRAKGSILIESRSIFATGIQEGRE